MFSLTYISTKKPPALFFQLCPTPHIIPTPLLIIITMSKPPIILTPRIIRDSRVLTVLEKIQKSSLPPKQTIAAIIKNEGGIENIRGPFHIPKN